MGFIPVINHAFSVVYWPPPTALIATTVKSSWFKGILGETLVNFLGKLRLPTKVYHRIHNVTLQASDSTTQIDHIFPSRFGIFEAEAKNMQGWIFGGQRQAQWKQKI